MNERILETLKKMAENLLYPNVNVIISNFKDAILIVKEEDLDLEGLALEKRALNVLKQFYLRKYYGKKKKKTAKDKFCPFIKTKCRGNKCGLWHSYDKGGDCSIVSISKGITVYVDGSEY